MGRCQRARCRNDQEVAKSSWIELKSTVANKHPFAGVAVLIYPERKKNQLIENATYQALVTVGLNILQP
jgi:hypothetical protein